MPLPNVTFVRPELARLYAQYKLIRDCISGEPVIKDYTTTYLPMPNAHDQSPENKARYKAYLKRAVFYNVTRRTLAGLVGQVFMRDPVIKVPDIMEPVLNDATGSGVSLVQCAKKSESMTLAYSRSGVLIDYPTTDAEGGATIEDLNAGKVRPIITTYSPMEIINWRVFQMGAVEMLCLVVIFELYCVEDDGFEMKRAGQFRVLSLDENLEYVQQIWREVQPRQIDGSTIPNRGSFINVENLTTRPKGADGLPLKEIPFKFIGSENNDTNPDNPNMYDLASVNIAHYRNSADYEEACYVLGQPTLVTTGLHQQWIDTVLKGEAQMGSMGGLPLGKDMDAKLLQAEPNMMIKEAMEMKERQMVALGAKLVEQKDVQRTAFETKVEATGEGSILSSTTKNVSEVYLWALKWCARLMNLPDDTIEFELNTDFDIVKPTADELKEDTDIWQKGGLTWGEYRTVLRKAGKATEDDDEAKAAIANDMVAAMALAMPANVPGDGGVNTDNPPPSGKSGKAATKPPAAKPQKPSQSPQAK